MIAFDQETCSDLEAALSKEWLETNGLGGYASSTLPSCNTRRYHGLLVVATRPPLGRMVLVNLLEDWVVLGDSRYDLACHQYPNVIHPQGYQYLIGFRLDPWPVWTYRLGGILLEKSLTLIHGQHSVIITYRMVKGNGDIRLILRPLLSGRDFHGLHHENPALNAQPTAKEGVVSFTPYEGVPRIFFHHNGESFKPASNWYRQLEYAREQERGLEFREDCWSPGVFEFPLRPGERAVWITTTEGDGYFDTDFLLQAERQRRRALLTGWEGTDDVTQHLVLAADQFVVSRDNGKSLIAGYPWFADWGRDTFIALPGLLLVAGRFNEARAVLETFPHHLSQGMIPNRFADWSGDSEYNSADASLWYGVAVFHYLRYTQDFDFVRNKLWTCLKEIVHRYQEGARFGIHADADGLLVVEAPGYSLTWMDAKVGDWVVTPRAGKPVELQALWHNTLRISNQLAERFGERDESRWCRSLADQVWNSFNREFWYEEGGYLFDAVRPYEKDASLRPNQVFALSLPFDTVTPDRAERILAILEDKLLTPFGLRTLDPRDSRYKARCEGDSLTRDVAYHQGTVWPWLLGPFLTAYQKVHGRSPRVQTKIRAHLALLLTHLWEAGLGSISEIFDGDPPHEARGCIAQAWSVGEILRVMREELSPVSDVGTAPGRLLKKINPSTTPT